MDGSTTVCGAGVLLACGLAMAVGGCGDDLRGAECSSELDWGRGGEFMLPGSDCISCHRERGSAARSRYSVAGTVFARSDCPIPVADAVIRVVDGAGSSAAVISNGAGNFFSEEELVPPFAFAVEVAGVTSWMFYPVDSGSCGRCHAAESDLGFVFVASE